MTALNRNDHITTGARWRRWRDFLRESLRDNETDFTSGPIGRALGLLAIPMMLEMGMEAIFAVDPNIQMQRNMQYNIGFQREIGFQTAIEIRYVGGRSNNMVRGVDFNQINLPDAFLTDFRNATTSVSVRRAMLCRSPNCAVP